MYLQDIKIIKIEHIKDYIMTLHFRNKKKGTIDFSYFIDRNGVFQKFLDLNYFKNYQLIDGNIIWGDGELDIAPETLYHIATGEPYPDWLNVSEKELNDEKKAMVFIER